MLVKLHPEARAELRSAAIWYDDRRAGLGDELVETVNETLGRLAAAPGRFPLWPSAPATVPGIHRAPLGRFPYSIAFQAFEHELLVLALVHDRRRPLYWLPRA